MQFIIFYKISIKILLNKLKLSYIYLHLFIKHIHHF